MIFMRDSFFVSAGVDGRNGSDMGDKCAGDAERIVLCFLYLRLYIFIFHVIQLNAPPNLLMILGACICITGTSNSELMCL